MSGKRNMATSSHGAERELNDDTFIPPHPKIMKTDNNEADVTFEFPKEPTVFTEDMVIVKNRLDREAYYIPFRTLGLGRVMVTKEMLTKLLESDAKVEAGIWVDGVPEFDDSQIDVHDDWEQKYQDHYQNEIGSFLRALNMIGEGCRSVLSPYWYKKFNWNSIYTLCSVSSISYDVFIHFAHNVKYEWHSDAQVPRPLPIGESQPDRRCIHLNDLKTVEKWLIPVAPLHMAVWVIDSRITYSDFEYEEAEKVQIKYYEYSSEEGDFKRNLQEFNREEKNSSVKFKHGTVVCKILCKLSSNQTKIHFVKVPQLGAETKHILHGINDIFYRSKQLKTKFNIVVMTLGNEKFRSTQTTVAFQQHQLLHEKGFIFICSAGNIKLPKEPTASLPAIPNYPTSFFQDCRFCLTVGGHGENSSKEPCIPSTFFNAGCCVRDEEGVTSADFKQGVLTWSIGENLMIPKVTNNKSDTIVGGTSVATAVVTAISTFILPKVLKMSGRRRIDKIEYSKKLKVFIEQNSDLFVCPKHGISRNLIFNIERCMLGLGYEKIMRKEDVPKR